MNKKVMLFVLAVASLAASALPAIASAAVWETDVAEKFTVKNEFGTNTILTQKGTATKVTCVEATGEGSYAANRIEGTLSLIFKGCTENVFGSNCMTSGAANKDEIKLTGLRFDNVMIESTAQVAGGTPGINITPPTSENVFTNFTCAGGINFLVTGNGVIGDITTPKCGESSKTATIDWQSKEAGVQRYTQVETAGTVYDLISHETLFGTTTRTAAMDATAIITFANTRKIVCP